MAEVETRMRTRHFVSRLRGETTRRASTCVSSFMVLEVLQYGKADDVSKTYPKTNPQYEEKRASVKRSDSRRRSRSRDTIDCGRRPSRRLGRAGGCSRDASHHLPRRRARIVAVTDLHRLASDRVVARGSEATRAAKRRRRGSLTAERGVWLSSRISSRRWFGRTPESARNARRGEETREYPSRSEHAGEIDASRAQGSRWCWAEAATRRAPRPKRGNDREVRRRRVEKRGGKIKIYLRSSPRLYRRKFPQKKRRGKMQNVRKRRRNRLLARLNERRLEQTRSGDATVHELA